jgi:hypothetical protein
MHMNTKRDASASGDRTDIESVEYYLPSMPSERLVAFLSRTVRSLNQYNKVSSYRR